MGLLRYQIFWMYGVVVLAVWYASLQQKEALVESLSFFPVRTTELLVDYAPLWVVVALGIYAATTVFYNVLTFSDCPEAALELERQVQQAKTELQKRGIVLSTT